MPAYAVEFLPAAQRELSKLPLLAQRRIVTAVEQLAENPRPRGVVKLAGDENLWRIRVGPYRVVYEIHDGRLLVLIVRIGQRKDVYRKGK